MPIPQSQLETWARQGAVSTSADLYGRVRDALQAPNSPLVGQGVEIFLQGSYGNSTNIYGDSDVDVVVLHTDTFYKDLTGLPSAQQLAHESAFLVATYNWPDLRNDVMKALQEDFGTDAVRAGNKAIKVEFGDARMTVDVVPAMEFRQYASFQDATNLTAYWGIQFFDRAGNAIANFPKYHKENGEAKNQSNRTGGQYKATIRIFKNFRNWLVANGYLADGVAPSYFIEGALYNVPDHLFVGEYHETVPAILNHLWTTPYAGFMCQNGVLGLIGVGSTQWSEDAYVRFIDAAIKGWNNW